MESKINKIPLPDKYIPRLVGGERLKIRDCINMPPMPCEKDVGIFRKWGHISMGHGFPEGGNVLKRFSDGGNI
jgi:hypothetical protein